MNENGFHVKLWKKSANRPNSTNSAFEGAEFT